MHRWRQLGIVVGVCAASLLSFAAVLQFLAPSLSYRTKDRITESFSGNGGRRFRIALGVATGSYYRLGTVLNRYLKEKAGRAGCFSGGRPPARPWIVRAA